MILSTFPLLLNYHLAAPALIRIIAGIFFLVAGYQKLTIRKAKYIEVFQVIGLKWPKFVTIFVGIAELIGGVLLFIGLFTQIAALVLAIVAIVALIIKSQRPDLLERTAWTYVLLLAILLSLLLSGAGSLALDLPL